MAAPEKKHNCFLLNFLKGSADSSSASMPGSSDSPEEPPVSVDSEGRTENVSETSNGTSGTGSDEAGAVGSDQQQGEEELNAGLEALQADPLAFMGKLPVKYDEQGKRISSEASASLFNGDAIRDKSFVDARDGKRQEITELDVIAAGRAAFAENDQADGFTDTFPYSGLGGMEDNGLMSARLEEQPWSDDYWAIYLGMLGHRYADSRFPGSWDWKVNLDYIQDNPALRIVESGNRDAVNQLSPSEKYDLLVGDTNMTLTGKMWDAGKTYYRRNGKVEPWMGLCHGWAPAAYMLARPTAAATVLAADGKTFITFYPSDIKALATLLWAKVRTTSRFIGGRCNDKDPAVDPQTGRILSQKCFDTNPGTWHLAVVNQIGASRRSRVLDATSDYEF
ncbi:MAG: hypothetical protein D3910_14495, partial [Candidatus Electrothrix sp. ATG2]|nr:hypothetical protein [Candidatus Electrothrix sp. ATG2]